MNENLPPPFSEPPPVPPKNSSPLANFQPWQLTGLGALLFIVTTVMSFVIPPMCLLGLAVAIASLFFKGYRLVFVGYIATIGVILLGLVIYCSNHPFEDR